MDIRSKRAGKIILIEDDIKGFDPAPLPPKDGLDMDGKMLRLLSQADLAVGRLDGISGLVPEPDLFVMMYIKKEAVWSSQIEGTQASLMDVLQFEGETLRPDTPRDVGEVVNYIGAMQIGLERIIEGRNIDLSLIRELHSRLMKGVRGGIMDPGNFREVQNWIGPPNCSIRDAFFVPPPPKRMITAMKDLVRFINEDQVYPPLISSALAHAQFESIHPFLDGNGKVGRLIIILMLIRSGHLQNPLLYLSHYFKRQRTEYYDLLQKVREEGAFEEWTMFFLEGVRQTARGASKKSLSILELVNKDRERTIDELGRNGPRGSQLINGMLRRPVLDVNGIKEITGLSYQNANKLVSQMEYIGILKEITGQKRNRIFEYKGYLDLLED